MRIHQKLDYLSKIIHKIGQQEGRYLSDVPYHSLTDQAKREIEVEAGYNLEKVPRKNMGLWTLEDPRRDILSV